MSRRRRRRWWRRAGRRQRPRTDGPDPGRRGARPRTQARGHRARPTRSHRRAGEQAAPPPVAGPPPTARASVSVSAGGADAQQVGYVTAPAHSPLHPVLPGLRGAPQPRPGPWQGAGQREGVREWARGRRGWGWGWGSPDPVEGPQGGGGDRGLP